MKILLKIAALICCFYFCASCSRNKSLERKFDEYFDALEGHFMGSVLIRCDGKDVYQRTMGFSDVENRIPATSLTQYRIGSISKTFTAVLVLKAATDGMLSLDDPLEKYFPDAFIPNASQITIDHLLQHRSGLVDIVNEMEVEYFKYHDTPQSRRQMIRRIAAAGVNFPPDSDYRYCNAGYHLLTYILEDVYGKTYAELVKENIAVPAGLLNTRYSESIASDRGDALSYEYVGDWMIAPETDPSVLSGAGSLVSTPSDLARFADYLFDGGFGDGIQEKMTEMDDVHGRGLHLYPTGYGHAGSVDGFYSLLVVSDSAMVVFCSNGMDRSVDIVNDILNISSGKEVEIPKFGAGLDSKLIDTYAGTYFIESLGIESDVLAKDGKLYIESMGQYFPLEPTSDTTFRNDLVGLEILMDISDRSMVMNLNDQEIKAIKR